VSQPGRAAHREQPGALGTGLDPRAAFQRAQVLVDLGRSEEAVALLRNALAGQAGHPDLWGQLAMALYTAGRAEETHAAAARCIELAPQNEWGYRLASLALTELGRHRQAVAAAHTCVALEPGAWQTHARLARAAAEAGPLLEAWDAAVRAVQLAPEEPEAHMAVGSVAMALHGWPTAEQAYRHVLSLEPDNAAARSNLALVTLRRGELTAAAAGFADAVATDPRIEVARRNLEITIWVGFGRLLRWQFRAGTVGLLGLAAAGLEPFAAGLVTAAVVGLALVAVRRWRVLPAHVRHFARSLPRTEKWFARILLAAAVGYLALVLVIVLSVLGEFGAAWVAAGAAVCCTVLASLSHVRVARRRP
jgi:Flp pilus assembly protein TadD